MTIEIIDYQPKYRNAFRDLNKEWIDAYFEMEESDYKALDNPDEYIIQKGGAIIVILCDNGTAGVCALIKMDNDPYDYELAKMAISPKFKGKGLGYTLGKAVIEKAKQLNAKKIYLETNTKLTPAINLYYKLGFKKIDGYDSPYDRCDFQMELNLK